LLHHRLVDEIAIGGGNVGDWRDSATSGQSRRHEISG
jgi:hypothetical protein